MNANEFPGILPPFIENQTRQVGFSSCFFEDLFGSPLRFGGLMAKLLTGVLEISFFVGRKLSLELRGLLGFILQSFREEKERGFFCEWFYSRDCQEERDFKIVGEKTLYFLFLCFLSLFFFMYCCCCWLSIIKKPKIEIRSGKGGPFFWFFFFFQQNRKEEIQGL